MDAAVNALLGDKPESLPAKFSKLWELLAPLTGPQGEEIRECARAIRAHPDLARLAHLEKRATSVPCTSLEESAVESRYKVHAEEQAPGSCVPSAEKASAENVDSETATTVTATAAAAAAATGPTPGPGPGPGPAIPPAGKATAEANSPDTFATAGTSTATVNKASAETTTTLEEVPSKSAAAQAAPVEPATENVELGHESMGANLVPTLEPLITQASIKNEVSIPPPTPIDLGAFKNAIDPTSDDCPTHTIKYNGGEPGQGHCFMTSSDQEFKWPDFSKAITKLPTIEEAKKWLDQVINNPPKDPISYYLGHGRNLPYRTQLNPGRRILDDPLFGDIHEAYYHIGDDMSGAFFHNEDASHIEEDGTVHGLRSANAVLVGIKIWLLIAPQDELKFRTFAGKNWCIMICSRGLSHLHILVSPSRLDAEGIGYVIKIGYPGNLIITHQAQHHMVINMGPCIAQSINFALPGDSLCSPEHTRCRHDGLALFAEAHNVPMVPAKPEQSGSTKRKRVAIAKQVKPKKKSRVQGPTTLTLVDLPSRTRSVATRAQRGLDQAAVQLRKSGHVFLTPTIKNNIPSERIFRLVCSLMSRATISSFYNMAAAWNLDSSPISRQSHAKDIPPRQRAMMIKRLDSDKDLSTYLQRYHQLHLHLSVEAEKQGQLRLASEIKKDILEAEGMGSSNFDKHVRKGMLWKTLGDIHCGLLPLISCYANDMGARISTTKWLTKNEFDELNMMMENIAGHQVAQNVMEAAEAFVNAVEKGEKVVFRENLFGENLGRNEVLRLLDGDKQE
ncbi:lysine -specific demethylase 4c-like protein [Fusarium austroafricanum]|uniref:Lysine -specific demethylase 4c-like protein n=1 Tax=Fusarium austroafricanum TaxID=2364996 RepID=A0A8H4KHX3_9HYPO|nr:lysine -specific demethylase 4c-like protein [Fusarium austroafricanum]